MIWLIGIFPILIYTSIVSAPWPSLSSRLERFIHSYSFLRPFRRPSNNQIQLSHSVDRQPSHSLDRQSSHNNAQNPVLERCSICLEDETGAMETLACSHRFHEECIHDWWRHRISQGQSRNCPLCRTTFNSAAQIQAMENCAACASAITNPSRSTRFRCSHSFHQACIMQHVVLGNNFCPTCHVRDTWNPFLTRFAWLTPFFYIFGIFLFLDILFQTIKNSILNMFDDDDDGSKYASHDLD